ncbi:ABC transporter [Candidatus Saccharibacteria bacterium]|nr:MAG: ABC transporter [Candidatus Saccharibacteria bacterium]
MQKQTLKLFWQFAKPYAAKRNLAVFFPMLAVITTNIVGPYVLSLFLNLLQSGSITFENSMPLVLMYSAIIIAGDVFFWRLALYFCWTFQVDSMRDAYRKIFHTLSSQTMDFHANRFGGSLVSQTSKFVSALDRFWDMIVWNVVPMLTMIVGAVVALTLASLWQYAIIVAVVAVVFISTVLLSSRFIAKRNTLEAQADARTSGVLADAVTNISTVKSFGRETYEYALAEKSITNWYAASTRLKWGIISTTAAYSLLIAFIYIAALVFAVYAAVNGLAEVGSVYLIFIYTINLARQLWEMNRIVSDYNKAIGDAHDMTEILHLQNDIVDDKDAKKLVVKNGDLKFDNVSFAYDKGDGEEVFSSFNLEIPAGQRVGIVGRSGSGKSTLTRIILRFADIQSGSITIDDQAVSRVTQQSLHEAIAYVPQEPLLFHRSLRENIAYAKPDATEKEIKKAAEQANALDFIESLADGFDTLVGERGVKLSGGQRQRIAIARTILKDAPILVLDEATSALDSESEKLIQASLGTLMERRTSIVIAHRLSTIAKLDRIIVLDNGKIVEDGTHAELLAAGKTYATLWSHQSGGFIEE